MGKTYERRAPSLSAAKRKAPSPRKGENLPKRSKTVDLTDGGSPPPPPSAGASNRGNNVIRLDIPLPTIEYKAFANPEALVLFEQVEVTNAFNRTLILDGRGLSSLIDPLLVNIFRLVARCSDSRPLPAL